MSTSTAWLSCSAAAGTFTITDPHARFNVRVIAGPGPGLAPELRRDCPRLVAVERLSHRTAAAIHRVMLSHGGLAFYATGRAVTDQPGSSPASGSQPEPVADALLAGNPPLLLSGTPEQLARLFLTTPEPRRGLWSALSHALMGYDAALANPAPTRVMGILNVTPDSFSDGGHYLDPGAAEARAWEMVEEGADILDIGGESTRPGARPVSAEEELGRVLPVVQRLAGRVSVPLSVDTTKAAVARACLEAGATIINDVSGLTFEPKLAHMVAQASATLILMHMPGTPATMQEAPRYGDVVADTMRFLRRQMQVALDAGVSASRIWIDPGFGFGKTVQHNLEILRRLREYTSVGAPVMIGTSRKSTLGHVLGDLPASERVEATAATIAVAIANGASIVRVHDVKEMVRVARMADAVMGRG